MFRQTNKLLLFSFLSFLSFTIQSQEYRKYWRDGKLTWEDFKGKQSKKHTTNLAYIITYKSGEKTVNNTTYRGVFSDAYIDKSLSFVHPNLKSDSYLHYNQVLFNLIELEKRKFQQRIYKSNNHFNFDSLLSDSKNQLERKIYDFQEASAYGIADKIIEKWLIKTEKQLKDTENFIIPNYKKSNWSYGMNGGLDFGFFSGNYNSYFNNTIAFAFGFEFSYKKVFMALNMSLTNSKVNKDLIVNSLQIPLSERATNAQLNGAFGYEIYTKDKFRITPFVGYGFTTFGEVSKNKDKEEILTGSFSAGLNFDFKNKKKVNLFPVVANYGEEGFSYFRARVFVNKSNFNPNFNGYIINIGLLFGIEASFIHLN